MTIPRLTTRALMCLAIAVLLGAGWDLAGAVAPGVASGAEPDTWGPPMALPAGSVPSGDEPNGDLLLGSTGGQIVRYSPQEDIPSLSFFGLDGTLGTPQRVTGSEPEGGNGPVAFLPGGAAVVGVEPESGRPLGLTVRSAAGAYGPLFHGTSGRPIEAIAAREGEVLAARERIGPNARPLVEVATLSIDSGGTLTETGSEVVFEMPAEDTFVDFFRSIAVAMGPDGSADVVMLTENEGRDSEGHLFARNDVLDFHRSAAGEPWSGRGNLAAGLPFEAQANELQAAAAPGGRAILAFTTSEPIPISSSLRSDSEHLYESVREPEGSFSGPVQAASSQAPEAGYASAKGLVAAGADGTLALAYRTETCQTIAPVAAADTYGVSVVPPGKSPDSLPLVGYSTADRTSRITALGAGHGQALVGMDDAEVTSGGGDNLCEGIREFPTGHAALFDDRAVLVGPAEPLDGDEFVTKEVTLGAPADASFFIDSAAIDDYGDAAVTGALGTSGGTEYAYFTGSGKLYGGGAREGGETGQGDGGETGTPGGGGDTGTPGGDDQTSAPSAQIAAPTSSSTTTTSPKSAPAAKKPTCKKNTRRVGHKCVKEKKKHRKHKKKPRRSCGPPRPASGAWLAEVGRICHPPTKGRFLG